MAFLSGRYARADGASLIRPTALAAFPERGSVPKELAALGIQEYRQVFFKPYRILYRLVGDSIYVYLVADGRRDMQALLAQRLLGG